MIRRASLLVTLSLLISAATAYADCAWVLWVLRTSRNGLITTTVSDAFTSLADCKKVRYAAPMQKLMDDAKRQGATINPVCLPDTVDPREPKGGGR